MDKIKKRIERYKIVLRKKMNPLLGSLRRKKLNNTDFTIISNNCWGGGNL